MKLKDHQNLRADSRFANSDDTDNGVATTSWEQIQDVCSTFASDREAGKAAGFKEYLEGFDPTAQETVVRNLLHVELQRRRAQGDPLELEAVVNELPRYEALIRKVFLESTEFSRHRLARQDALRGGSVTPSVASFLGDYQIDREVGRGGMGAVFEAIQVRTGERVALKTLPVVDPSRLHRFKREFRSMAEINHPNLVGLHSLEQDGGHWFFTMDLINGRDFLSYVRPNQRLDEQRLRNALAQLVVAVMALHSHGIIHRDLKPSNVLVNTDGRVIVLDFGLVLEFDSAGQNHTQTENIIGTPAYMAPEQARQGSPTGAADWYGCGVMLYEALAGRHPFRGKTPMDMILAKQNSDPTPFDENADIPSDLAALALRLLARHPKDRPGPLEMAREVAQSLSVSDVVRVDSGGSHLVGREKQLLQLEAAYSSVGKTNRPAVAFVRGRSGEGKTSLVDHFLKTLNDRDDRAVIISGRCYDRESLPHKALDSLIDALTNHLRRLPDAEAALVVPDDIDLLAGLFPVLRRVSSIDRLALQKNSDLDSQQVRKRSYAALRSLIGRLSRNSPVVMFADDLQWGDADSADALADLLLVSEAPPILFIGSYRSDESDSSAFVTKWKTLQHESSVEKDVHEITVSPLTLEDTVQLTISTVGRDNEIVRQRAVEFHGQTGGNAFLLTELIGCFDPSIDSFEVLPIAEMLARKLSHLPDEATPLLDVICVAGRSVQLAEATRAINQSGISVSLVTHMRSEKLVRFIGQDVDEVVDTYHDKIRETILGEMDPEHRKSLHGVLAKEIEETSDGLSDDELDRLENDNYDEMWVQNDRIFDLAFQFDAAGESRRAAAYGYLAGRQASLQFSQQVAAEQFALARRNQEKMCASMRFRIGYGEARALSLMGQYDQATDVLDRITEFASDSLEHAQIIGLKAEVCHKQGSIKQGMEHYSEALRKLGYWSPKSAFGATMGLAYESTVQLLHTILPKAFYQRTTLPDGKRLLAIELANRNSIVCYYRNTVAMLWTHLKGMNLSETRSASWGLAYSYGLHPAPAAAIGLGKRGIQYSLKAEEYAVAMNDQLTQGHCLTMRSMAQLTVGDFEQSATNAAEASRILDEVGDPYIRFIADCHRVMALPRLLKFTEAIECAKDAFQRSVSLGEDASACGNLLGISIATEGNVAFPELRACLSLSDDATLSHCWTKYGEGMWHQHAQRWDNAIECFEEAWRHSYRSWIFVPSSIHSLLWLIAALRRRAETTDDTEVSRASLKRAYSLSPVALSVTRLHVLDRTRAFREHALLLEHKGKTKRTLEYLERSLRLCDKQGDQWNHALTSVEYGRIRHARGESDGKRIFEEAQAIVDSARNEIAEAVKACGLQE